MTSGNFEADTEGKCVHGHVLSGEPIVIYGRSVFDNMLGPAATLASRLRGRKAYFLVSNSWSLESRHRLDNVANAYFPHCETYPEHDLTLLCNSPAELEALRHRGIKSEQFNNNIFVDEELFRIIPGKAKQFDAVYNARMAAFKRHSLAAAIDPLLLIYYFFEEEDVDYHNALRPLMHQATFLNGRPKKDYHRLDEHGVARNLSACRIGLCLSEIEGTMKASMEYLLCGLPVVTTPNIGGRDLFLDGAFSLTVAPDAQAIKNAVGELVEAKIDPQFVRDETLRKVRAERERFIRFVQRIYDQEGIRRQFRDDWPKIYVNNLIVWNQKPEELLRGAGLL